MGADAQAGFSPLRRIGLLNLLPLETLTTTAVNVGEGTKVHICSLNRNNVPMQASTWIIYRFTLISPILIYNLLRSLNGPHKSEIENSVKKLNEFLSFVPITIRYKS